MTFKEATERMLEAGFTLPELAKALGLKYQTVRAMRTELRSPPKEDTWRPVFSRLATKRAEALWRFADDAYPLARVSDGKILRRMQVEGTGSVYACPVRGCGGWLRAVDDPAPEGPTHCCTDWKCRGAAWIGADGEVLRTQSRV